MVSLFLALNHFTQSKLQKSRVCFNDYCFKVEIAKSPKQRAKGLMFRKNLGSYKGMLFIFPEEKEYAFWMKNTLIALDIIWINKDKKVVHIERNVQPCRKEKCQIIKPSKKAIYVLEVNAGATDKIGLKVGDELTISQF